MQKIELSNKLSKSKGLTRSLLKFTGRSFAPARAGKDFDAILMEVADKFEKSDNKGKTFMAK
jgi:hypothetical protein